MKGDRTQYGWIRAACGGFVISMGLHSIKEAKIKNTTMKYEPTIYVNNTDNTCRFALGTEGVKPLIVIGINPSTANDKTADPTIRKVMGFAECNGFNSFIMLNLYPQRTPYPADLHPKMDSGITNQNLKSISELLGKYNNPTILAAWSERIVVRDYLKNCLKEIFEKTEKHNVNWTKLGEFTKTGHPRHPLYAPYALKITDFNPENYIDKLK